MRLSVLVLLYLGLWALVAPVRAQDTPDLTKLPVLRASGELAADELPDQGFWLEVAEAGLYRIALNGPGMVGLTGFATPDGRSDGSDPQERLMVGGSAYLVGTLDDLLLVPGYAYLVQIAATELRGVRRVTVQTLDPDLALTGDAIPGATPATPMQIAPGQEYLLRPDGPTELVLTGAATGPMILEAIRPPGTDASVSFEEKNPGAGGIFPVPPFETARMQINGRPGLNGTLPLLLVRTRLLPARARYDEIEPGDTPLGILPHEGRDIRGALMAGNDRMPMTLSWIRPMPLT